MKIRALSAFAALFLSVYTLSLQAENAAGPVNAPEFTYVKTVQAISEYTLNNNGLQVLLMPEHSAPVLTFMVTYRVGSRNEVTGTTGATHLLEHMMFKGTDKFLRSKSTGLDQILERIGAVYNATTSRDRTNYYENIPSDHLAIAVEMEADRMRHLLLREEDRKPEMSVVRNEFERGENSPFQALIKEIYSAAFVAHPYHHPVIGWRSDIEKVPIEKLREFYDTFYYPENATVSVIGDFAPEEALRTIAKFYGPIERAPKPIPQLYTEEPDQTVARHVGVERAGELGVVAIAHKIPASTHADIPALRVLSAIFTDGKNSRLYRALTDKNLTTDVDAYFPENRDPTLHITFAPLAPGIKHEEVEHVMIDEIERLKKDGVTTGEVTAAINKYVADSAYQRDGSFNIAARLNEFIAVGDWTLYYTLDEGIKKVTPADVQRVANIYWVPEHSTIGYFIPVHSAKASGAPAPRTAAPSRSDLSTNLYFRDPEVPEANPSEPKTDQTGIGGVNTENRFATQVMHERIAGIDVLLYRTGVQDVVTFRGALPAGTALSPENPVVAKLTGELLDKGTALHDKYQIAEQLDNVGATLRFTVDNYAVNIFGQCLRKDVPLVISLLAEQLRQPAFHPEDFEKAKKQLAGALRRQLESTDYRADDAFAQSAYPAGHPNRTPDVEEMLKALPSVTLDQVKAFHQKCYGGSHMILAGVGDIDTAQARTVLSTAFKDWTGGVEFPKATTPTSVDRGREETVLMPDKASISVIFGQTTGLSYDDPDALALRVGTAILGSGFTGRLMANVRDKEGLTYGISAESANDTFNGGDWRIRATFAPALLQKGLTSTKRQLDLWYESGVTSQELENRKKNLVGRFKVGLATTTGLAQQLLVNAERGNDPSYLDRYPEMVDSLTLEKVNGAIKAHVNPSQQIVVEAGTIPGATEDSGKK